MTSGPCHAAGCSAQSPLPLMAATLLHVALHPPSCIPIVIVSRQLVCEGCSHPRVTGMAERMTLDTRWSGQLFVISHTDSQPTGRKQHWPQGSRGYTEEQSEQWTTGGFVVTRGWHGPCFTPAPQGSAGAVPGPAVRTAVWLKDFPAGAAWGGFPGYQGSTYWVFISGLATRSLLLGPCTRQCPRATNLLCTPHRDPVLSSVVPGLHIWS